VFALLSAAPDFAEVYKFIGSVFDPGVSGHLRRLKEMTAIDRETVSCKTRVDFVYFTRG
jgi:hypothetical protein